MPDESPGDPGSNERRLRRNCARVAKQKYSDYFVGELLGSLALEDKEERFTHHRERVYTFIRVPLQFERFCIFAVLLCWDMFLHMFTFLPLKFILASFFTLAYPFRVLMGVKTGTLSPTQRCDLIKGFVILFCCGVLLHLDVSVVYHVIRGQSIIKLYIFFNMLEVGDKLLSSAGQDILDALYLTASEPMTKRRQHLGVIPHLLLAVLYTLLHSALMILQLVTINVAFNSQNKSLLTIMLSNNFVEIKSNVFRKFSKSNLFQVACADAKERFHYAILLVLVSARNVAQYNWEMSHLWVLLPDLLAMAIAEVAVDWTKHAFITKFNEIPSGVYQDFKRQLCVDCVENMNNSNNRLDTLSRRLGLMSLPVTCVTTVVLRQCAQNAPFLSVTLVLSVLLSMMLLKVLLVALLMKHSGDFVLKNSPGARSRSEASVSEEATPRPRRSLSCGSSEQFENLLTGSGDQEVPAVVQEEPASGLRNRRAHFLAAPSKIRRIRSQGDFASIREDSEEDLLSLDVGEEMRRGSVLPHSGSMLSLNSIDVKYDTPVEPSEVKVESSESGPSTVPLGSVDRFTMCGSGIS